MADMIKYLSLTGLAQYDFRIKEFIDAKVSSGVADSFKYVNLEDGALKFYTINPILETTEPAFELELPVQDLSNLMALVKDATAGNIAVFGENGQVVDSGVAISSLATKEEVEEVQTSVDELADYVGTIPEGYEATNIVAFVNKKAEETLNSASGGSTESAASVKAALDSYKAENDPKVAANTENVAKAQKAAEDAQTHSDGVAADLVTETSERKAADEAQVSRIATLEEQILNLSGAMHFRGVIEGDALPETTEGYENGDVVIFGNKEYVVNNGAFVEFGDVNAQAEAITALTGRMDGAESEIDQLQTDLGAIEVELAKKIEQGVVDAEVAAREEAITAVTEAHNASVATLEAKDAEIEGKVTTIEADVEALKAVDHQEISISEIDELFNIDEE